MAQFDWVNFYKEFAKTLLSYYDDRATLIQKVKNVYQAIGMKLPTLERDNAIVDIDPFTVFGLFNKGMKESNRIKIIKGFMSEFSVGAGVPSSFDSIPVLFSLNATFYYFIGERGDNDIDNLWNLFVAAMKYAQDTSANTEAEFAQCFDIVINQKGVGNRITMGLYWISPETFLNLDSRNRWFIYESGRISAEEVAKLPTFTNKPTSEEYLRIIKGVKEYFRSAGSPFSDFKELSQEAWRYSEEVNQEKKAADVQAKRGNTGAALADEDVDTVHYWIYSPGDGATKWDEFYKAGIMGVGWGEVGDIRGFTNKQEIRQKLIKKLGGTTSYKNAAHALWQFVHEMKPGDIIFAKKGMHQLIGRGVVTSDYEYDGSVQEEYKNVRKVNWTHNGEWPHPGQAVMKTLTDITSYTEYVEKLKALFEDETVDDVEELVVSYPPYTAEDFLDDVYMGEQDYNTLVAVLKNKKNVILQGAPGVGKTYAAKRLAYSIMGVKDKDRVMMVQFHQSYSYEDFIMGFRPTSVNFELKKGAFYNFCKKAEVDSDNEYFFIIDEINRGNLSKIFGELFMMIENDKRGVELQLLYSDEKFSVPENVYIIGMMNTADRSLAMLDYALRRRFAFIEMKPGFETDGFRDYRMSLNNGKFDKLIACVESLNNVITTDESLGEGFCIGHSYFCNLDATSVDDQCLSCIVEFELIPLLKEYWYDEPLKVKDWSNNLRSAIK